MTRDTSDRLLPARLLPTSTRAPSAPDTLGRAPVGLLLHGQRTGFGGPPVKAAGPLTPACSRRRCRPRLAPRERDPTAIAQGCPRPMGASAPRCAFEHPARAAPVRRLGRRRLRLSKPLPAGSPKAALGPTAIHALAPCQKGRALLSVSASPIDRLLPLRHTNAPASVTRSRHPGHPCRALRGLEGSPLSSRVEIRSSLPPRERRKRRAGSRCR